MRYKFAVFSLLMRYLDENWPYLPVLARSIFQNFHVRHWHFLIRQTIFGLKNCLKHILILIYSSSLLLFKLYPPIMLQLLSMRILYMAVNENHMEKSNHTETPPKPHWKALNIIITLKFSVNHTEICLLLTFKAIISITHWNLLKYFQRYPYLFSQFQHNSCFSVWFSVSYY